MATQKDIARELGISVSVVSRALNPKPDKNAFVSPEMRRRILESARRLRYRPNRVAQSLRRGRALVAGAFLPVVHDRLVGELMQGISEVAVQENLPVMFYFGHGESGFEDFWRKASEYAHSGIITHPTPMLDREELRTYRRKGGKVITIDPYYADYDLPGITAIGIDDRAGGRMAAERLWERGCRRFVNCGDSRKRREGFEAALRERRCDYVQIKPENILEAVSRLQPTAAAPLGVFAGMDYWALEVCNRLQAAGVTPGREVLVIGYDDLELTERLFYPLTTIRQPFQELGRQLMTALIALLAEREVASFRIAPQLVVRATA